MSLMTWMAGATSLVFATAAPALIPIGWARPYAAIGSLLVGLLLLMSRRRRPPSPAAKKVLASEAELVSIR
jgi:hypothetical protein